MFDYLNFTEVEGSKANKDLKMLSLSTCGFCKRAKAFLKEQEIRYSYVDVDSLEKDVKKQLRREFAEVHGKAITYPTLFIDGKDILVGFVRPSWITTLELEDQ